jgi:hypothetical protein
MRHQFIIRYYDYDPAKLILEHVRDGVISTETSCNLRHPCFQNDIDEAVNFLTGVSDHYAGFRLSWEQVNRGTTLAVSEEYEL